VVGNVDALLAFVYTRSVELFIRLVLVGFW